MPIYEHHKIEISIKLKKSEYHELEFIKAQLSDTLNDLEVNHNINDVSQMS